MAQQSHTDKPKLKHGKPYEYPARGHQYDYTITRICGSLVIERSDGKSKMVTCNEIDQKFF